MIFKNRKLIPIVVLLFALAAPLAGYAQCKGFAKRKCLPVLKPFIHNGQLNSTTLMEGESAELVMTFHAGQQYRVMVCAQETLKKIGFKMMDTDREIIFDSAEQNGAKNWDFNVNATQQMIILVEVPKPGKHAGANLPGTLVQSGCVALLVGFQD
ncbi:MAG: hypothetical protein JKX74_03840 [Flavobacteriales bacterium]|nr:hypothetical protein [Flavobacteriales bacterium]PCH86585.1 MAG: hypothetical protein COB88_07365 [Flavobacteriales bacterium]